MFPLLAEEGCRRQPAGWFFAFIFLFPIAAPAAGANAPPAPVHNGKAYWIKVSARTDGTFTVTNQRNGFFKTYAPH